MLTRDALRLVLATPFRRAFRAELAWVLIGVPLAVLRLVLLLVGLAMGVGRRRFFWASC